MTKKYFVMIPLRYLLGLLAVAYILGMTEGILITRKSFGALSLPWWYVLLPPAMAPITWYGLPLLVPCVHWVHDAVVILRAKVRTRLSRNLR
jgi:hypothetical protein